GNNGHTTLRPSGRWATVTRRPATTMRSGPMQFDGVDAGAGSSLANLGAVTVSAWIYPRLLAGGGGKMIVSRGYGDPNTMVDGWNFMAFHQTGNSNTLTFEAEFTGNDLGAVAADNALTPNQWQHVLAVWDGSAT